MFFHSMNTCNRDTSVRSPKCIVTIYMAIYCRMTDIRTLELLPYNQPAYQDRQGVCVCVLGGGLIADLY